MKKSISQYLIITAAQACLFHTQAYAALTPMDESEMQQVNGQAGVTLETNALFTIGEAAYTDDGQSLQLQNIQYGNRDDLTGSALNTQVIDVLSDGSLQIDSQTLNAGLNIGAVRVNDSSGSFGQLRFNYSSDSLLRIGAPQSADYYVEGSYATTISDAELIWTTNGQSLSFRDIGYSAQIGNLAIGEARDGLATGLNLVFTDVSYGFSTGGMFLGEQSLGTLAGSLALDGSTQIYAGGAQGNEGLRMNAQINIADNPANFVRFTDDGNSLYMGDFNGDLTLRDLTFDVMADHLQLGVSELSGSFNANQILIGDSSRPVGAVQLDFLFADANGHSNVWRFYPGIVTPDIASLPLGIQPYASDFYAPLNDSSDGLSMATEWSLANAEAAYIDDNRMVVISGIESYGRGDLTLDVRAFDHDNNSATADKTAIAVGMNRFTGSYSIDGLRVGTKDSPIQGGAELLLSLELFQAMDFNLDGYTYITAGGTSGGGIQVDGDYLFSDTNIGLSIDENGKGVWATGVNYDLHLRGLQFDVSDSGISLNRTEQWSTMNVDNMRWGDRNSGRSLGRIVLERYEKGSSLTINPGGAGAVCVGGAGSDETSCAAAGGRWEDRGNEGMTVALKVAFEPEGITSDGSLARNRLTWENNRTVDGSNNPVNGTGTQIIFDGFSTNDGLGPGDGNDYGFQADLKIDVYETRVAKKFSGLDDNGVSGNQGDELIYNDASRTGYSYVANPDLAQQQLRPLGFAVQGNVSFRDLQIDSVQLKHPDVALPETVFSGVVLQNFDITTNLTATPIR